MTKQEHEGGEYTARDVREIAGLSYRQLNEWDRKGLLPGRDRDDRQWRRFTPRDVFILMVCSEFRKLGVPLDRIKYARDYMTQEPANHFLAAVELMGTLGVPVLLVTDFKGTFVMDSVLEWIDLLAHGYLSDDSDGTFVMLKVNPIVNRILGCLKEPIRIPNHGKGYSIIHEINGELRARSEAEGQILDLVRSGEFQSVEVVLKNGEIDLIRGETEVSDLSVEGLRTLIAERRYEKITLAKHDGKIVRAVRSISIKSNPSDKAKPTRQKAPERPKKAKK